MIMMMDIKLPSLEGLGELQGKTVLLRADLDVDPESSSDELRLKALIPTIEFLVDKGAAIIIIGHRGRPQGKPETALSLEPVSKKLESLLRDKVGEAKLKKMNVHMMENLRFDPGEEKNDAAYANELVKKGDSFVNEAFAASHREHASIVALPKILPHAAGARFVQEVKNLSKLFGNPKKPVVVIIGGAKKDKLEYIEKFEKFADRILVGGRLPEYLGKEDKSIRLIGKDEKVVVANLIMDKEDITMHSIERFEKEIEKAKTIVLVGPMGKFEEEGHRQGTQRIFKKIAEQPAFKIAGGGDTLKALDILKLENKFEWVSVGGGATLEFLAEGTLPGIEALVK